MRASLAWLAACALAACAGPRFLGVPIAGHCATYRACRAWAQLQLDRAAPGFADDAGEPAAVHAYVVSVLDRIIRANHLAVSPRVRIVTSRSASAKPADVIYVGRTLLAAFDSEAELAALLAHELVHVEAGSTHWFPPGGAASQAWWRAAESAADERAVQLVTVAGYDPRAVPGMLAAVDRLDPGDDPLHPDALQRRARVAALVARHAGGELGRARYRRHIDGLVLGVDPRLGTMIGRTGVSLAVGVAIAASNEAVSGRLISPAVGERVTAHLEGRRERQVAGHRVVTGSVPRRVVRDDPVARTARDAALADALPGWLADAPGAQVVLVCGPAADLWFVLDGPGSARRAEALVAGIRAPTAAERAQVRPRRLRFHPAAADGEYASVAAKTCASASNLVLEDPHRRVRAGEPIKCADLDP